MDDNQHKEIVRLLEETNDKLKDIFDIIDNFTNYLVILLLTIIGIILYLYIGWWSILAVLVIFIFTAMIGSSRLK